MLEDACSPELRRAVQPLIDNGVRTIWHCDGNIMPIFDHLIDTGVSDLQGFQEEVGVPHEQVIQVKSKWGRPLIVSGCVSVTTTLPFGTVEDVGSAVRRSFALAGPGRSLALASTSSTMPRCPTRTSARCTGTARSMGGFSCAAMWLDFYLPSDAR